MAQQGQGLRGGGGAGARSELPKLQRESWTQFINHTGPRLYLEAQLPGNTGTAIHQLPSRFMDDQDHLKVLCGMDRPISGAMK